jgi:hypothetical protein
VAEELLSLSVEASSFQSHSFAIPQGRQCSKALPNKLCLRTVFVRQTAAVSLFRGGRESISMGTEGGFSGEKLIYARTSSTEDVRTPTAQAGNFFLKGRIILLTQIEPISLDPVAYVEIKRYRDSGARANGLHVG